MWRYHLLETLDRRRAQRSFHVASEQDVRIEIMRFCKDETLGPLSVERDVVITCLEGVFDAGDEEPVTVMTQLVIPGGERFQLRCTTEEGAVHLIWVQPTVQRSRE